MFTKILIANRGEIACRVAATARRMGIRTVAVFSDADANARHVALCDEAVSLGGNTPQESYLRWEAILAAARATGAQAIHPGYGFLSENEAFAEACAAAGLAFIGPPAAAIQAMGLKAESKRLMEAAGVPLVPGYHGADQNPALLRAQAQRIGYPVLIKASAGGGGKGMRVVERDEDFDAALASCQREARSSFGSDAVLVERYVQRPRHIEIQVFGDTHGQIVHLFERDCSVQRRHQKVLEEAPAPGMTPALRERMGQAAVAAARAVNYVGAGTVEFIVEGLEGQGQDDSRARFYFMEMNTRLQVEHPVTEAITGQDLVEWQLRVAAGEPLPLRQDQLVMHGHAIEARICAENPDNQFLPATGTLSVYRKPAHAGFERAPVRFDDGVREGDAISPYYDSMIAKLIVHGDTREQALARLDAALADTRIVGLPNNVQFLRHVVASRSFAAGARGRRVGGSGGGGAPPADRAGAGNSRPVLAPRRLPLARHPGAPLRLPPCRAAAGRPAHLCPRRSAAGGGRGRSTAPVLAGAGRRRDRAALGQPAPAGAGVAAGRGAAGVHAAGGHPHRAGRSAGPRRRNRDRGRAPDRAHAGQGAVVCGEGR